MQEKMSFVITSCGRVDLLNKTLESFFKFNSFKFEKLFLIEDSVDEKVYKQVKTKWGDKLEITLNKPFILVLIYVVLFPGLAAFICWIKGISMIGPNRSGVFLHLMPILSACMAMIIFKEKFMLFHILGAIFILIGIILSNKSIKYEKK